MSAIALSETELRGLVEAAERAHTEGQSAEAVRLLAMARSAAPEHPSVLSACAVQALRLGEAAEAKALIERAISRDAANPRLYLNLASALRELQDGVAEMAALQQALALDPYFYFANFQKASLLELQGRTKLAAGAYQAALSSLPPGLQIPPSMQPVIAHAQRSVQSNMQELEDFLRARMHDARERHSDAPQERVNDCLASMMGRKRIYVQQPTFTHFPRLPAIEFFDRRDFAWLAAVEAASDDIRDELAQILETSLDDFAPYVTHSPQTPLNQWQELNHSRRWSSLYLFKDGRHVEENIGRCPKTVAALAGAPVVEIPGRGPTSFFSRLEPNTRIPPHTGVSNTRLIVHLPLIVPPDCGFRVGSSIRDWRPGTALIFDDTIEHEAWNLSSEPRVILIFDIWNPLLTAAERELMAVATAGIAEFYGDTAPAYTNA
jgi:aspartate beta-hydroxylase